MFLNSLKMQLYEMLRKKTVVLSFFIVLTFVLVNFFTNMSINNGIQYVSQMHDPIKKLTLSDWSVSGYFFMQYFPILVVFPTACAYLTDKDTRVKIYIESKMGKQNYWSTKLLSVFITTFLVFTIPFIIELLLNVICFDMSSSGDPSGFQFLQTIEKDNQYFLYSLYISNKIIYALVMICIFGIISGVLAIFNFSLSTLPLFKYKIFTFFPLYILIYIISFCEKIVKPDYTMNYSFILRMFNTNTKNNIVYLGFLVLLTLISILIVKIKTKKDDII